QKRVAAAILHDIQGYGQRGILLLQNSPAGAVVHIYDLSGGEYCYPLFVFGLFLFKDIVYPAAITDKHHLEVGELRKGTYRPGDYGLGTVVASHNINYYFHLISSVISSSIDFIWPRARAD